VDESSTVVPPLSTPLVHPAVAVSINIGFSLWRILASSFNRLGGLEGEESTGGGTMITASEIQVVGQVIHLFEALEGDHKENADRIRSHYYYVFHPTFKKIVDNDRQRQKVTGWKIY